MKVPLARSLLSPAAREALDLIEPRVPATAPSFVDVIAHLQRLTVADAIDLGFSFADADDHSGDRVVHAVPGGLPAGMFTLELSPQRCHRALQWHEDESDRLRLWIDAREIVLPIDTAGDRLVEPTGQWISERLFAAETLMPDHPQQDFSRVPGTGQIRGLLVCDAENASQRLERPRDDEIWTLPLLRVNSTRVRLYADRAAFDADAPAREWELGAA